MRARLGNDVGIGAGSVIASAARVDNGATIGENVQIGDRSRVSSDVRIGRGTVVGEDVIIDRGIEIGVNVTIGDRARVTMNLVDGTVIPDDETV